jgi:hypothetical protein
MDSGKLAALASTLAVVISDNIPDDDDLTLFAIALDLLGDNLDAIIAQRILAKKKKDISPSSIKYIE